MDSIFHRVSIRKPQDKPVEPEKIEKLLSRRYGGSFCRKPAAVGIFYVVMNRDLIQKPAATSPTGCQNAPALIVSAYREDVIFPIRADRPGASPTKIFGWKTDALGLGGGCIAPNEERMHEVESVLQMPAGHHAFAISHWATPPRANPSRTISTCAHPLRRISHLFALASRDAGHFLVGAVRLAIRAQRPPAGLFLPGGGRKARPGLFESASVSPKIKTNKSDTHYQVSLCWWELVRDSNHRSIARFTVWSPLATGKLPYSFCSVAALRVAQCLIIIAKRNRKCKPFSIFLRFFQKVFFTRCIVQFLKRRSSAGAGRSKGYISEDREESHICNGIVALLVGLDRAIALAWPKAQCMIAGCFRVCLSFRLRYIVYKVTYAQI